jgi:hypothetical protein
MKYRYNENGDLVIESFDGDRIVLRQAGWLINGGPNDGLLVKEITEEHKSVPMGGFSPVYVEVGD